MRRQIVTVVAAAATTTLPAAAGVTNTITIGPDTPGWYDADTPTSTVPGGFDGTLDSLQASGTGKNQFYLSGADIGATTIGDIASITYSTNKAGDGGSPDWFIQIYTTPYEGSPGSSWYGNRVQAEPYLGSSIDAPGGQWNTWSTETGTNQLNWGDSSNGDFGASLGSFESFKAAGVMGGSATYGDAGILSFTFGTGSGWAAGFDGQLGPITIGLRNGSSTIIAFAASIPVVPGPVGLATLAGLACLGSRRRR